MPVRRPDNDLRGVAPAPGWDARYDWQGWLAAADNPQVDHAAISARGWHATANQRIHGADYPHFIGSDWNSPERQQRIDTLLGATGKHSARSMAAVQGDIVSLATQRLLPVLQGTASTHAQASAALAALKGFDRNLERAAMSAGAAGP